MLNSQMHLTRPVQNLFPLLKPVFLHGNGKASLPFRSNEKKMKQQKNVSRSCAAGQIKALATATGKTVSVKAVIIANVEGLLEEVIDAVLDGVIKLNGKSIFSELVRHAVDAGIDAVLDSFINLSGKSILLELVSDELNADGTEKKPVQSYASKVGRDKNEVRLEASFKVPSNYGPIGAVVVENQEHEEMFLKTITLDGLSSTPLVFNCDSWIQSKFDKPNFKRIFFTNKSYLPSQTPAGLRQYRKKDMDILQGVGLEDTELKSFERVYQYAMYNDLGDPEVAGSKRPVLGGKEHPYPRRCRTGRPPYKKYPEDETRSLFVYVPSDEQFSWLKLKTFGANTVLQIVHSLLPSFETQLLNPKLGFPYFTKIDLLFYEGYNAPPLQDKFSLAKLIPGKFLDVIQFDPPQTMARNKFFWLRSEEFARQTLAGLNPYAISLVTEWPLKSKLDPAIYGPPESAITTQMIEEEIKGYMTVEEAIKQKKLFILDYNDLLLPFVKEVRKLEGTTLYGSRTLFFLNSDETLKTLAIELTCPPIDGKPQWKQVFRPSNDATGEWLWKLALAQVFSHDLGYHELVIHWLRAHACTEPYIIATYRQLSAMHPIFRLMNPHFRYTMQINAFARIALINAGGVIESAFSPGIYSMEISSAAYDLIWQFNLQGLPADLISRGLAVEDPTEPHGLKLAIQDYPFANDGLILWDCLKEWISTYVNYYYSDDSAVESDAELQAWWTEIRTVGHGDKKDEPWWPVLKTREDLIGILTTMAWVCSGHHAAVNFGQYAYGGYFPNKPSIARINMPTENPDELFWENFMNRPDEALLQCYPSQIQATRVMAILNVLSTHSPDEEYLGESSEPAWVANPVIKAAYERFTGNLKELEATIDKRNADTNLKNRNGAGLLPYELLKPFSEPGVTGKGVPYSISI